MLKKFAKAYDVDVKTYSKKAEIIRELNKKGFNI